MKPRRLNRSNPDGIQDILNISRPIPVPKNLFQGIKISPFEPRNMLVFPRLSKRSIIARGFRSHHERYVLITSMQGSGHIGIDAKLHLLKSKESILIFPYQTHWFPDVLSEPVHWIVVTFEHAKDRRLEVFRNFGSILNDPPNWDFLRGLVQCWSDSYRLEMAPLYLSLWIHSLLLRTDPEAIPLVLAEPRRNSHEWIAQVNQYIFDQRHEPISLKALSEGIGMSESLMRKKFRSASGISIGKHIREVKLRHACELLHDTTLRIGEIALRCGYDSIFSFSRAFHHIYGLSPTDYRMKFD